MSMPNNSIFCLRFFFLPGSMASSCDRHHTRQSSHLFLCVPNKEKGDTLPGVAERACGTEACWSGAEACGRGVRDALWCGGVLVGSRGDGGEGHAASLLVGSRGCGRDGMGDFEGCY